MNNIETRLTECFTNVFPGLKPNQIAVANAETLSAWDSVAHITLLTAVGEEFRIEFEPDDYVDLLSYRQILAVLKDRL
jgi:acyl carrier protein